MPVTIVSLQPANGSIGVSTRQQIRVLFDKPIDPNWIGQGTIFLESSDKEVKGPFAPIYFPGTDKVDVLSDPAYHGITKGSYSYQYVDTNTVPVASGFQDTDGSVNYYTLAAFTPTYPLSPSHPYKLYVVGTSTGTGTATITSYGVRSRSVFDCYGDSTNAGTAKVYAHGSYQGTDTNTYIVEITTDGMCGTAQYKWRRLTGGYEGTYITHKHLSVLQSGLKISFGLEGTFKTGDKYRFMVKPPEYLAGVTIGTFITGPQGTENPPENPNTSLSTVAPAIPSFGGAGFNLAYTIPSSPGMDLSSTTTSVAFVFNENIDTSSTGVNTAGISIYVGPANGDTSIRSETRYNPNQYTVSGSSLTIFLDRT